MVPCQLTLDELDTRSLALRELLGQMRRAEAQVPPDQPQIDALTGDHSGPAVYDLHAIWRASLEDPDCVHLCRKRGVDTPRARRYLSPRRFVNRWSHMVTRMVQAKGGRILVDRGSAIFHCQLADVRVFLATVALMGARRAEAARRDPIGTAVASAGGGGFAMMDARFHAREILGLTDAEFDAAVMGRARHMAATMDVHPAERLLCEVRRAIQGDPRLELIRTEA